MARDDSANELKPREVRIDRLLGRPVLARNGKPAGRLEEFRAEMRGQGCVVTGFIIGAAGLLERLGIGVKLLIGHAPGGYVARWDQLDLTDPHALRLTCPIEELERI